jgi:small nuclear ribonucleoprotein (snRNP)-like protein
MYMYVHYNKLCFCVYFVRNPPHYSGVVAFLIYMLHTIMSLISLPLWQQKIAHKTLLFKVMNAVTTLVLIEISQGGGAYLGILVDVDFSMNCTLSPCLSLKLSDYAFLDFSNPISLQKFYQDKLSFRTSEDGIVDMMAVKSRSIRSIFFMDQKFAQ